MAETSLTLDRGLALLELLAATPSGLTVTAAAAALDLHRPVVHRFLATLEGRGLARRGPDGLWTVGFGVLPLAREVQPLLRRAALPVLRRLAEQVGATAHVTVADGDEALAVAVVEPPGRRSTSATGSGPGTTPRWVLPGGRSRWAGALLARATGW